jgi:hypothetical protein
MLAKFGKPLMAMGALVGSAYGTYNWNKTKQDLHLDKSMSKVELHKVFAAIDTDNSGFIDEKELLAYLKSKGVKVNGFQVHEMMKVADETKDGRISLAEWDDLVRETHEALHPGAKMVPTPNSSSSTPTKKP